MHQGHPFINLLLGMIGIRPRKINVLFQVLVHVQILKLFHLQTKKKQNKLCNFVVFCNFFGCARSIYKNFVLETEHLFYMASLNFIILYCSRQEKFIKPKSRYIIPHHALIGSLLAYFFSRSLLFQHNEFF